MLEFKQKSHCEYIVYDLTISRSIGEIYKTLLDGWFLELNERCNGINLQDVEDIYVKMKQLSDCTPNLFQTPEGIARWKQLVKHWRLMA